MCVCVCVCVSSPGMRLFIGVAGEGGGGDDLVDPQTKAKPPNHQNPIFLKEETLNGEPKTRGPF